LYFDSDRLQYWNAILKNCKALFQTIGEKYAMDNRREEGKLQEEFLELEKNLQVQSEDEELSRKLGETKHKLRKFKTLRNQGVKVRSRLN